MPSFRAAATAGLLWAAWASTQQPVAAELTVELLPDAATYDVHADPTACGGGALESCQDVGVGNMASTELPMGSAGDMFMALRFQDFASGGLAASTDRNVGSVLADFAVSTTMATSRMDELKELTGTANVDLFLCSDEACSVIADIAYVYTGPDTQPVLAMGYLRFPNSLVGLPIQHITGGTPYIVGILTSQSSEGQSMEQSKVAWEIDGLEWVAANPVMMPYGALVRFLSLSATADGELGSGLGSLRMGAYVTSTGECVYIVTFSDADGWMDAQGWGTSHDCVPDAETGRVYVFDSYFPQANLVWPGVMNGAHQVVFTLADAAGAGNWQGEDAAARAAVAAFGRTLFCDSTMYGSDQTVAPAAHSCYVSDGVYGSSQPGVAMELSTRAPELLVVGNAAISAWDITEDALTLADAATSSSAATYAMDNAVLQTTYDNYVTTYTDYFNVASGDNPVRGDSPGNSGIYTKGALGTLLKHAVLSSEGWSGTTLPWCSHDARGEVTSFGYVQLGGSPDDVISMYNCTVLYDATYPGGPGWGYIGNGTLPVVSGAQLLAAGGGASLRPSWTSLEDPYQGSAMLDIEGRGFAGAERTFRATLKMAAELAASAAAAVLDEYAGAELSSMDATLTALGAVLALSQTVVALLATYMGRREIVVFFVKRRVPLPAARVTTVLIFGFGLIVPAALVVANEFYAREGNPSGDEATVRWVRTQAHGYGPYTVVGAVTMSFDAQYDAAAYTITWLNLALATLGWLWCAVYVMSRRKLSADRLKTEAHGGKAQPEGSSDDASDSPAARGTAALVECGDSSSAAVPGSAPLSSTTVYGHLQRRRTLPQWR